MKSGTYPWSEGHCVLKGNKWYFVDNDTGTQSFVEYEGLVVDSDHLELLVRKTLESKQLVGLN